MIAAASRHIYVTNPRPHRPFSPTSPIAFRDPNRHPLFSLRVRLQSHAYNNPPPPPKVFILSFILRCCIGLEKLSFASRRQAKPGSPPPEPMARKAKCTCVTSPLTHSFCPCFQNRSILSSASPSEHAPPPPRCLLLGLSGSGKTTFLYRVKTGEFFDVKPTSSFIGSLPLPPPPTPGLPLDLSSDLPI